MHKVLVLTSSIAGGLGVLVCAVAGLARMTGFYYLAGYQSTTLFSVGTALMVFACLIKLEMLLGRSHEK